MFYIVATPIGNLKEITYRAVEVLKSVDIILAEDTRHSINLLREYGIDKPLVSYQKFNERAKCEYIINNLKNSLNIALISDAGMPLISDPGFVIVEELVKNGLEYTVISGASACINAVVLSGLDTSSFCFAGFIPEKNIEKKRFIEKFAALQSTLIFYSPPQNVLSDLDFLFDSLGGRRVSVVREISKKFESVTRGILGEKLEITLKGEFVIVVDKAQAPANILNDLTVQEHIDAYIEKGMDKKDAVKAVARDRNVAKSIIYKESIESDKNN